MAKGIPGSSHTRYQIGRVREDTKPMASKYHPTSAKASKGQTATKGKKGC